MIKNFHNGKAIKKYKKKIKKQAKIINGLLDFLEKLGYDKKRWAYWEKNGRREYTSFSIPNDSNLIKITIIEDLFKYAKKQATDNLIKIPKYGTELKVRRLGHYEKNKQ